MAPQWTPFKTHSKLSDLTWIDPFKLPAFFFPRCWMCFSIMLVSFPKVICGWTRVGCSNGGSTVTWMDFWPNDWQQKTHVTTHRNVLEFHLLAIKTTLATSSLVNVCEIMACVQILQTMKKKHWQDQPVKPKFPPFYPQKNLPNLQHCCGPHIQRQDHGFGRLSLWGRRGQTSANAEVPPAGRCIDLG